MAEVTNRIKNLGEYFMEMKVASAANEAGETVEYIYVTVSFPHEWVLDGRTAAKYNVECANENGVTYFWAVMDVGFEKVFDAIDYNIKVNKEAQEKVVIFNEKLHELRDLFSDESYDVETLKGLRFVFDTPQETTSKLPFPVDKPEKPVKKKKTTEVVDE